MLVTMIKHKPFIMLLSLILFMQATSAAPISSNATIVLPIGTFQRGNLICRPTEWTDVVAFILTNYVAHAATVRTLPGEQPVSMLIGVVTALFFPINGVFRAIDALVRHPIFLLWRGAPLQAAARAGALCMVVRSSEWQPQADQTLRFAKIRHRHAEDDSWCKLGRRCTRGIAHPQTRVDNIPLDEDILHNTSAKVYNPAWCNEVRWYHFLLRGKFKNMISSRDIHGRCDLVKGYCLQHVPPDARMRFSISSERERTSIQGAGAGPLQQDTTRRRLSLGSPWTRAHETTTFSPAMSSSYSWVKALVALLQSMWSVSTLVRARGDQIATFGYAAFGLTVTPYAIMSMVNLIANALCPTYSALYLVHSEILDEAIGRGSKVDGVVGELIPLKLENFDTVEVVDWHRGNGSVRISKPNHHVMTQVISRLKIRIDVPSCMPFQRIGIDGKRPVSSPDRCIFSNQAKYYLKMWIFPPLLGAVLVTVVGIMSHFQAGASTPVQRVWVMCWMIFGCISAHEVAVEVFDINGDKPPSPVRTLIPVTLYAVAAIGGYVMVIQMLYIYGTCVMVT